MVFRLLLYGHDITPVSIQVVVFFSIRFSQAWRGSRLVGGRPEPLSRATLLRKLSPQRFPGIGLGIWGLVEKIVGCVYTYKKELAVSVSAKLAL